jgi:hypothetical protein
LSCDAPRNNPVDPNNPNNKISTLSGQVKGISFPNAPVENADIRWEIDGITINSDPNGDFQFVNLTRNDGWLYINHPDYSGDSIYVVWNGSRSLSFQVLLNIKPVVDSLEIFSIVENRFQITQKYLIVVRARIFDADGQNDIDSVFVENPELEVSKRLVYNVSSGFYEGNLSLSDLNTASLNEVIGKDFIILVRDLQSRIHKVATSNLKRVINEEILTDSPKSNEVVTIPFFLRWKRFEPGFSFHYLIRIHTNETPSEIVWELDNVSSESISYLIDTTITGTDFYWTIWAVDEFKNRTRSKPATFQIIQD